MSPECLMCRTIFSDSPYGPAAHSKTGIVDNGIYVDDPEDGYFSYDESVSDSYICERCEQLFSGGAYTLTIYDGSTQSSIKFRNGVKRRSSIKNALTEDPIIAKIMMDTVEEKDSWIRLYTEEDPMLASVDGLVAVMQATELGKPYVVGSDILATVCFYVRKGEEDEWRTFLEDKKNGARASRSESANDAREQAAPFVDTFRHPRNRDRSRKKKARRVGANVDDRHENSKPHNGSNRNPQGLPPEV